MKLCNNIEQQKRIFDWVQTYLDIDDEYDLNIFSYSFDSFGVSVEFERFRGDIWIRESIQIPTAQILLLESFRK